MGQQAVDYRWAGQLDRAIPLFERTLEGYKANLGSDHVKTLEVMSNLVVAYALCGDFERAIAPLE